MTPEQFCYWLQGHLEISKTRALTGKQVREIRNHLKTVFQKVTPGADGEARKAAREVSKMLRSLPTITCSAHARLC